MSWRILFGVGDEKDAADVLYIEGREAFRNAVVASSQVIVVVKVAIAVGVERIIAELHAIKVVSYTSTLPERKFVT